MGLLDGILDAVGIGTTGIPFSSVAQVATGILGFEGQQDTNKMNYDIAQQNSAFNAQQAQMNRDWQTAAADKQMNFQANQVAQQMGFQERMSNSAYQRATADMKAAGLNPMLAYSQGGASSPTGGAATGASGSGAQAQAVQPAPMQNRMAAGLNAAAQAAQIDQTAAQTAKTKAEEQETYSRIPLNEAKKDEILSLLPSAMRLNMAKEDLTNWEALRAKTQAELNRYDFYQIKPAELARLKEATQLLHLDVPKAMNEAEAQKSWWMRNVAPYVPDILKSTHSAGQAARIFK